MSEDQWAEVRQRLRAAGEQFQRGLREIQNDQTLRRALPRNGDQRSDTTARLRQRGEQLRARRRQQMMRGLAAIAAIGFMAGWLGGRLAARGRGTAR